jgi:uncharacterized membrane protein YeaQ/YmgE (transglycosylase-associated protein family)
VDLAVTILIGFGIGIMVELLLPGHTPGELVLAMFLGAAGALLTRYIGEKTEWYGIQEPLSFLVSGLGSILVLLLYGAFFRRGKHRR